jgi:hypothetical protein
MDFTRARALAKFLADGFPSKRLTQDEQDAYARAIAQWDNEDATYKAITQLFDSEEYVPTIRRLHEEYKMVRKRELDAEVSARRRLEAPQIEGYGKGEVPEWVSVWYWIRIEKDDFRRLPQQDPVVHFREVDRERLGVGEPLTKEEYEDFRQQWIAAGAPRVRSVNELTGAVRKSYRTVETTPVEKPGV